MEIQFKILLRLQLNGERTLDENIADHIGFKQSYLAYRKYLKDNVSSELILPNLNYTNDQMYWMSLAIMSCMKMRKEQLIYVTGVDTHTLPPYRINGVLSNIQEFADAFNCSINSKMNPEQKCTIL